MRCLERCARCARCRYISFAQQPSQDCSFYSKCNLERLHQNVRGFVSANVQRLLLRANFTRACTSNREMRYPAMALGPDVND